MRIKRSKLLKVLTAAIDGSTFSKKKKKKLTSGTRSSHTHTHAEGLEDVNDNARPERPSTETLDENAKAVMKSIMEKRQLIIREVAEAGHGHIGWLMVCNFFGWIRSVCGSKVFLQKLLYFHFA